MSFDNGSVSFTVFELRSELPEDCVNSFAAAHAGTLDSVSTDPEAEPQIGWVTGRHLLDNQIDEGSAYCGSFLNLTLRKAVRKVPGSLLNAICKREEDAYLKTNNAEFVPSKVRKMIKEDAVAKHLSKMPPVLSGIPMVADPKENLLYLGTASQSQIDIFVENFYQAVKVEPVQVTPAYLLEKHFQVTESSLISMNFSDIRDSEPVIGRDFLTYLWYLSENGVTVSTDEYGEFELMIEGPLTFAFSAEANGAEETVIKKGNSPQRSAEAKAALAVGKKLKKAKFSLTCGELIWNGVFDADKFAFSSVKLPDGETMSPVERFVERMEYLLMFKKAIEALFVKFASTLMAMDYPEQEKAIRNWADSRDAI